MDKKYCECQLEDKYIDWSDFCDLAFFAANITDLFNKIQETGSRYKNDAELNDKFEQLMARVIELMWEKYE